MADLKTTAEERARLRGDDLFVRECVDDWTGRTADYDRKDEVRAVLDDLDTLLAENAKLRAALAPFAAFAATLPPVGDEPRFTDSGALASGAVFADPAKPPLRFITYAEELFAVYEREVSRLRKEAGEKPKPEKKPDPSIYGKGSYFSESGAIIVTDPDGPCFHPVKHPDVRKVGSTAYGDWIRGRRGRQGRGC